MVRRRVYPSLPAGWASRGCCWTENHAAQRILLVYYGSVQCGLKGGWGSQVDPDAQLFAAASYVAGARFHQQTALAGRDAQSRQRDPRSPAPGYLGGRRKRTGLCLDAKNGSGPGGPQNLMDEWTSAMGAVGVMILLGMGGKKGPLLFMRS